MHICDNGSCISSRTGTSKDEDVCLEFQERQKRSKNLMLSNVPEDENNREQVNNILDDHSDTLF